MSYWTKLYYVCDLCTKEYEYVCKNKGPQFCIDGWLKTSLEAHIYRPEGDHFRDSYKFEGLYCPDCVDKRGYKELLNHTVRNK